MKMQSLFDSLCRAIIGCSLETRLIPAVALCFAVCISGMSNTQSIAQVIQWYPDITPATQVAKEQNKLILLHFTATWCKPCRSLETFVFTSPDVQRAFGQNVIAVKIDVDANPHLVQEYGVASVPFDVAVTPGGRVVSKRKSPKDSIAYAKMISDFHTIINSVGEGDSPALNQNLAELKKAIRDDSPKFEGQPTSFTPDAPSHDAPKPSAQSAELKRTSKLITNPYIQQQSVATQQVTNAFTPDQDLKPQPTDINLPANFAPTGNFSPPGNFGASNDFAPTGDFQPTPSQAKNLAPQKNQPQNSFVPAAAGEQLDNRSAGIASNGNVFQRQKGQVQKNRFMLQNQSHQAPVQQVQSGPHETPVQTNIQSDMAHQRMEQSKNDAVVDSELVQPRHETQKAEPKIVMDEKFFGNRSAIPLQPGPPSGSYQAKISLPESEPNDFVPTEPSAPGSDTDEQVAADVSSADDTGNLVDDVIADPTRKKQAVEEADTVADNEPIKRPRTKAIPASSSKIVSSSTDQADTIAAGLDMASMKTAKPKYALHGKCPVTLMTKSKWVDGNPKWGCVHRNRIYIFASEQNLKIFQADPDAKSPILAGYDPVIYQRTGRLVDGLEKHGVFMGKPPHQRIVLFANAQTRVRFQSEPRKYLESVSQAMLKTGASSKLLR